MIDYTTEKKDILLTFDYELFLGKSGTIEKCLIEPTNLLIAIFKKNNVRATFFVDTIFLQKIKKNSLSKFNIIARQLRDLVENGHRIELHLHPNWHDSTYSQSDNQWIFNDYRYYKLKNCPDYLLSSFFENGYEILTNIASKVDSNYKLIAFRAGGWCIDPFLKIMDLFNQFDILIDSSVLPLNKEFGEIASFDYTDINNIYPYRFDNDVHRPVKNGKFIEMPITVYSQFFLQELFRYIQVWNLKRVNPSYLMGIGDGISINNTGQQKSRLLHYYYSIRKKHAYLTLDGYRSSYFVNKIKKTDGPLILVGHPKVLSQQNLDIIDYISSDGNNFCNFFDFANSKKFL